MSILGRKNGSGRLDLHVEGAVVVLARVHEPSPGCALGCRPQYLCGRCAKALRLEAMRWLQGLADDHFGDSLLDVMPSGLPAPEIEILRRDPSGVVAYEELPHAHR